MNQDKNKNPHERAQWAGLRFLRARHFIFCALALVVLGKAEVLQARVPSPAELKRKAQKINQFKTAAAAYRHFEKKYGQGTMNFMKPTIQRLKSRPLPRARVEGRSLILKRGDNQVRVEYIDVLTGRMKWNGYPVQLDPRKSMKDNWKYSRRVLRKLFSKKSFSLWHHLLPRAMANPELEIDAFSIPTWHVYDDEWLAAFKTLTLRTGLSSAKINCKGDFSQQNRTLKTLFREKFKDVPSEGKIRQMTLELNKGQELETVTHFLGNKSFNTNTGWSSLDGYILRIKWKKLDNIKCEEQAISSNAPEGARFMTYKGQCYYTLDSHKNKLTSRNQKDQGKSSELYHPDEIRNPSQHKSIQRAWVADDLFATVDTDDLRDSGGLLICDNHTTESKISFRQNICPEAAAFALYHCCEEGLFTDKNCIDYFTSDEPIPRLKRSGEYGFEAQ